MPPETLQPNIIKSLDWYSLGRKDGFHLVHNIVDGATAGNYDVIFTAIYPCEILFVAETHRVLGTDGGAVTLNLELLKSAVALNSGTEVLVTAFDLKSIINTPVIKSGVALVASKQARQLKTGDRIALKDTGTLTALAGVSVTVYLSRLGKGDYK